MDEQTRRSPLRCTLLFAEKNLDLHENLSRRLRRRDFRRILLFALSCQVPKVILEVERINFRNDLADDSINYSPLEEAKIKLFVCRGGGGAPMIPPSCPGLVVLRISHLYLLVIILISNSSIGKDASQFN